MPTISLKCLSFSDKTPQKKYCLLMWSLQFGIRLLYAYFLMCKVEKNIIAFVSRIFMSVDYFRIDMPNHSFGFGHILVARC